jgi:hypothetical protein
MQLLVKLRPLMSGSHTSEEQAYISPCHYVIFFISLTDEHVPIPGLGVGPLVGLARLGTTTKDKRAWAAEKREGMDLASPGIGLCGQGCDGVVRWGIEHVWASAREG